MLDLATLRRRLRLSTTSCPQLACARRSHRGSGGAGTWQQSVPEQLAVEPARCSDRIWLSSFRLCLRIHGSWRREVRRRPRALGRSRRPASHLDHQQPSGRCPWIALAPPSALGAVSPTHGATFSSAHLDRRNTLQGTNPIHSLCGLPCVCERGVDVLGATEPLVIPPLDTGFSSTSPDCQPTSLGYCP